MRLMEEAAKFASGVLAAVESSLAMFKVCRFEEGKVITPDGWERRVSAFSESGWIG